MTVNSGDVLRVVAKMTVGIDKVQNVFHMQYLGSASEQDIYVYTDACQVLDAAYDHLDDLLSVGIKFDTIEMFNVTQDLPMFEQAWPTLDTGAVEGAVAPFQCAPLVVFGTDAPRSSGRKYLPPPMLANLESGGEVDSTLLAAMVQWGADFLADLVFGAGSAQWGVWSEKYSRFAPYVNAVYDLLVRTQRRRVQNVGE